MVAPAYPPLPVQSKRLAEPTRAEGTCAEPPLTSEPPLPDAEPLTSEPPLAAADSGSTRP
ncbi:hypothetical protein OG352_15150 [Streptomyces sp. NBC_01485]|uniref:hypothetical protein n=1 Tax=Streptomyces sp. NBC_01485 TaxID=2903884 RepID=UPI002E34BF18|nr:hypothetical protein [Streptomyces sp. NBC_01485]